MASTYTPAGIELIGTGEQSGTWGQTTNTNLELIEELATGVVGITLSATTYTLSTTDGNTSEGRHAVLVLSGSPGGACTITVSPSDMQKLYHVKNGADQTVTFTQGSGGNVSIATGKSAIIYCDGAGAGAAVVDLTDTFDFAKLDAAQTFTAEQTFTEIKETVYTLSGTAIDPANGTVQTKVLSADALLTDSLASGQSVVLMIEGASTYVVTWPTITWVSPLGDLEPTYTAKDTFVVWKIGSTLYGAYVGSYA